MLKGCSAAAGHHPQQGSPFCRFASERVSRLPRLGGPWEKRDERETQCCSRPLLLLLLSLHFSQELSRNVGLWRQPHTFADQVQDKLQILTAKALWPVMKALKENCKYRSYWQNLDLALGWNFLSHSGRFDPWYWRRPVFQSILNSWETRSFSSRHGFLPPVEREKERGGRRQKEKAVIKPLDDEKYEGEVVRNKKPVPLLIILQLLVQGLISFEGSDH